MDTNTLIDYLQGLKVTQGGLAGQPFNVLPWQKRFITGAFRGPGKSALSIARGNGKTALLAGVAAACLDGPLHRPRGEVLIVAASFEQARIAFEHVLSFMGDKLRDRSTWRVWDTAQQARIEHRPSGARVRCLASDPRRAHGLAPFLILADEPAQWPEQTGARMLSALLTAMGKHSDSRFVALGTRPESSDHWFERMLGTGGADYAQCHAAGKVDKPFTRRTWLKANPSLTHFPDLEGAIRKEAAHAKADPSILHSFQALRLNMGISDTLQSTLLDARTWEKIEGEADRAGPCVWGVDLGTNAAQSAVAGYWPNTGRLEVIAAFPCEPDLATRGRQDGVGRLYVECEIEGIS